MELLQNIVFFFLFFFFFPQTPSLMCFDIKVSTVMKKAKVTIKINKDVCNIPLYSVLWEDVGIHITI